jgi:hypothetical protein
MGHVEPGVSSLLLGARLTGWMDPCSCQNGKFMEDSLAQVNKLLLLLLAPPAPAKFLLLTL